jgi:hypothetical protein
MPSVKSNLLVKQQHTCQGNSGDFRLMVAGLLAEVDTNSKVRMTGHLRFMFCRVFYVLVPKFQVGTA